MLNKVGFSQNILAAKQTNNIKTISSPGFSKGLKQDTVSFSGLQSMGKALNTKGGKLGIAGAAFLLLLGVMAPKASAHRLVDETYTPVKHVHKHDAHVQFYFDSHGNFGIGTHSGGSRVDPGKQELEAVFNRGGNHIGWRPITRVFNDNNVQTDVIKSPNIIRNQRHIPNCKPIPNWGCEMIEHHHHHTGGSITIVVPRW